MTWYKQGLVAVTNNSNAIIGSGTAFISNARVGDGFRGPDGGWYEVTNIASDTAIAIAPNYQGVTAAGGVFSIAPMQGYVKDSADRLRVVTDQLNGVPEGVTQAQNAAAASTASASASATSAAQASASAASAATSVTAASTSATNAATSATAAATSATAASTSKTNAATSATAAATSATNSSNSATNSASSAAAAAASAAQAAQFPLAGGNLTGVLNDAPTQTIASAATTSLAASTSNVVAISGTATITSFGTLASGRRFLRFLGAATLTHNPVSLILPGGMNITTAANDTMEMLSLGGGNWFCLEYSRGGRGPDRTTGTGFIEGLIPVWNSATSISVSSGSAYIPGLAANVEVPSTLTLAGLSGLSASSWYYVYLYSNAGVPTIECVATAPSAAYMGTARTKLGDTSRRFICAVFVGAGGTLVGFQADTSGFINFLGALNTTPFRVLNNGAATAETILNLSSIVPPTTQTIRATLTNNGTTQLTTIGASDFVGCSLLIIGSLTRYNATLLLSPTLRTSYLNSAASGSFTLDVTGYGMDR